MLGKADACGALFCKVFAFIVLLLPKQHVPFEAGTKILLLCWEHLCSDHFATHSPPSPCSGLEVTFHKGNAKKIAFSAVPIKYEALYNKAEGLFDLTVEEFDLKLNKNSDALGTGWCWRTMDPLSIHVSPY